LLSNGYYLDLAESAERHYLVDPLSGDAANLSPEQQKMILGGEACMWSEMVTAENADSRIWPRNAAIAERLWSPAEARDVNSMYQRLEVMSNRLDTLGLTHHSALRMMQERLAADNLQALHTLADTVEPAKGYHRGSKQRYNADAPLNGLPDSIPPESIPARNFSQLVDRVLSGTSSPEDLVGVHDLMDSWRLNHQRLAPSLQNLPLADDAQVSQDLSAVGAIGLQALDMLTAHAPAPAGWADQQIAQLEEMKKRAGEVLLMIVPSIEKLVQSVGK
jgi:hexosaminidase